MIQAKIEEISPSKAKKFLESNKLNRPISQASVKAYADDMRAGVYSLTHQGIAFFEDGSLADGQHRLMAVMQSGVTVPMLVIRDMERTPNIDRMRPRSIANCCHIVGYEWIDKIVVAIVSALRLTSPTKATVENVLSMANKYKNEIQFVTSLVTKRTKGLSHASVLGAGVLAMINGVEKKDIEAFFSTLVTGIAPSPKERIVLKLRDFLLTSRTTGGGSIVRKEINLRTQRVIKAMIDGENLSRIYTPSEAIYFLPK